MREFGLVRPKSRLLTLLLAFVLPGAGHLYTGRYQRGLLLTAGLVLDIAAIIRLADANAARHLLFIVYLGIALPVYYFVSVFDALQTRDYAEEGSTDQLSPLIGLLLMAAGGLLFVLIDPPMALTPWMDELAEMSVGPFLMAVSCILLFSRLKGDQSMFRLGRITSAIFIIIIGGLLLWDQVQGRNDVALIGKWWPAVFILLGAEIVIYSIIYRKAARKLRFDFIGAIIAIVISLVAFTVTQYAELPFRWIDQYVDLNGSPDYGEEKGFKFVKDTDTVPFDAAAITKLKIANTNGKVTVRGGDTNQLIIDTEVWVDITDQQEAQQIADKSVVERVSDADSMTITAKGEPYGTNGSRKPRMNVVITVPQHAITTTDPIVSTSPPNIDGADQAETPLTESETETVPQLAIAVDVNNGPISAGELAVPGGLQLKSDNGDIIVQKIEGPIVIHGLNGGIKLQNVTGNAELSTKNGAVTATTLRGNLTAETWNGAMTLSSITGSVEADTKNGKVAVKEVSGEVKASTLNGNIELASKTVGGDWDLDSTVGEIKLRIPQVGDYSVFGSVTFGSITTDLPLTVSKKTVRGTIGSGNYRIQVNATNSIYIQWNETN
ncbi:DUF4097 family beta strand repeat-containing protein [Paenibacillus glycanilyticus]|uniref:Adhesin domain-containing protein n=1 Tax=Paenibacillus glycanilyticus TaxID=126569 RepID=A0ABQ6G759_9BACL|nr:DUF6677 family protein [Paenibacillus glycanilyticus]GLX66402.1 hypothetical protein MU1_07460 [Paenibacillus glycanilyticus]